VKDVCYVGTELRKLWYDEMPLESLGYKHLTLRQHPVSLIIFRIEIGRL
jgi:hypothetical protein